LALFQGIQQSAIHELLNNYDVCVCVCVWKEARFYFGMDLETFKHSFFWDVTLCNPLEVSFSLTLTMEVACSSEHWLASGRLHDIISQKVKLLITTTVRTSNPTLKLSIWFAKHTPDAQLIKHHTEIVFGGVEV
jgi:hypothetical protein